MSRLTASPFHKPSPFEFPRGLPSPPETNPDIFSANVQTSSAQATASQEFTTSDASHPAAGDIHSSRLRKTSSIPYHSPGFRDNKDRSSQRINRALILVIPPSTLLQEHGRDMMLTSGPYHRLSQGIVMPLLPSMFAQVTAIAREFNFPSPTGICLYYQFTENGLTLTPRISDDSWQTIWAYLSEPAGPNERRPLISGKIEFDIDHRVARWYSAWISSIYRDVSEINHYPATAPSYGHGRAESRTTLPDGRVFDEDDGSVIVQQSAPVTVTRHIPRKLSLVERFETASVRADLKTAPRSKGTPPESLPSASQAPVLSPIVQEEEPKTARQDLNSRVKSWRASAILTPTPLAATGQTSLEPVNLPNSMEVELQMEDFTWSISSPGPSSYATGSPLASEYSYIPSVHLDRRLQGSVCSTPSIRTSSGPSDYDPFSPTFMSFDVRVPSPDIAQRLYEDSPLTPLTATSWGAPSSYPLSPRNLEVRVPSPDIAQRMYEDSPITPMTATSWGAPLSYPPSPRCVSPVPSVDLGERARYEDVAAQHSTRSHSLWRASLVQAAHDESSISNWAYVWPYTVHGNPASAPPTHGASGVWPHVWPYNQTEQRDVTTVPVNRVVPKVWPHVWPYNAFDHSLSGLLQDMNHYPHNLQYIYPPGPAADRPESTYPYNLSNLYPPIRASFRASSTRGGYPDNLTNIYAPILSSLTALVSSSRSEYPHNLAHIYPDTRYSAAGSLEYPENLRNIYPPLSGTVNTDKHTVASWVGSLESYPYNLSRIYAPVYPQNLIDIYPIVETTQRIDFLPRTGSTYPHNLKLIYPPVTRHPINVSSPKLSEYPYHLSNIYPPSKIRSGEALVKVVGYPHHLSQLYPLVYPHNLADIYPSTHYAESGYSATVPSDLRVYPHNLTRIYPAVTISSPNVTRKTDAPGYPHNLKLIYPSISVTPSPGYPHDLASIYPIIDIGRLESGHKSDLTGYPHNLRLLYPQIALNVLLGYPHNLSSLYPAPTHRQTVEPPKSAHKMHCSPLGYPINLSNIYPALENSHRVVPVRDSLIGYPHNLARIYAPVYPYNLDDLYSSSYDIRPLDAALVNVGLKGVSSMSDYPFNLTYIYPPQELASKSLMHRPFEHYPHNLSNIYPRIAHAHDGYPHNLSDLYPPTSYGQPRSASINHHSQYPFLNLYPSVTPLRFAHYSLHLCNPEGGYPSFEIYPSIARTSTCIDATRVVSPVLPDAVATYVRYPTFNIYPAVYPHFNLYPSLTAVDTIRPVVPKPTVSSSRLTHAELHAVVMMEEMGSLGMMQRLGSLPAASNSDSMNLRSTTEKQDRTRSERSELKARSPLSRAPSLSQDVRKPAMPLSLLTGRRPLLDATSRVPSSSALPYSILRPAHNIPSNQLAPAADAAIPRSSSLRASSVSKPETPFPVKPSARRRDSLVFQRVRAYDNNVVESSPLSKETLAKFPMPPPMPPRMPLPPLPSDRGI